MWNFNPEIARNPRKSYSWIQIGVFSVSQRPNLGNRAHNLETESPILETGSPIVKQVPQFGKPDPPFMKAGPAPFLDPFRKPGPPIRETIFETWSPFWKT